jgi:hypothetical protein
LRSDNRWVKLAKQIPWEEIERLYASSLSGTGQGAPARSVRIAPGALIIKERFRMSDEETVEQIRENPYPQDFPGFKQYEDRAVFHSTLFVHFRKRLPEDIIIHINDLIAEKALSEIKKAKKNLAKMMMLRQVPAQKTKADGWLTPPVRRRTSIPRLI